MKYFIYIFFFFICFVAVAQQTNYIDFIKCQAEIEIYPYEKEVVGSVIYSFDVLQPVDSIVVDARYMDFNEILLNGNSVINYKYDDTKLCVYGAFNPSKNNTITIEYKAQPKKAMYFVGWKNKAPNQIWTQGQGKYTSNWLPSFDDVNEKVEFDLSISFNKAYQVISNGKLINKEVVNDSIVKWNYDMQESMSSYLVALAIGKYNKKIEYSDNGILLEMYYYLNDSVKVESSYRYSKRIFDFFETEIGVNYPWQNYKQVPVHDFLYAGMENTSITIFSDAFMIDDIAFVDKNYVNVNAHELAHQWFGDFVTAKSSEHHWLQEGFATYYALLAEREIFGDNYSDWKFFESAQQLLSQDVAGKETSLLNPKSSSLTFYQRGAWVLYALRLKVGDEVFKASVKSYLQKNKYSNVETNDFIKEVEMHIEEDLSEFVAIWIENLKFPFDEAMRILKQSVFIQEYLMVDCELVNSKCDYYLVSGVSDEAKSKIISQIPDRITSEVFKNNIKIRQSISQNLTKIPLHLKKDYESLLNDDSYITIENALYNLWVNFPKDRQKYLNQTKTIIGFSDKNIRQLWLALALSTQGLEKEDTQVYFEELIDYTSPKYGFDVRETAFTYLKSIQVFNENALRNLIDATEHHNWRFKSFSKKLLESLSEEEKFKSMIHSLQSE